MPYWEFVHHVAFYQLCPWGDDWKQTSAIAAAACAASTKFKRINLTEYFPKRRRKQEQSGDFIFGIFKQMALDAEARRTGEQRL